MPALRIARDEALAQGLAAGKTQIEAYRAAGFNGQSNGAPAKACNKPDVLVRTQEIIRERHENERRANNLAVEKAAVSKEWITTRAKYIVDRAIRGTKPVYGENGVITSWLPRGGDDTAAINGLKLLAQMGGYLIEKIEFGGPGDFSRMTDEELEKELVLVGESIGIAAPVIQKAIAGRT